MDGQFPQGILTNDAIQTIPVPLWTIKQGNQRFYVTAHWNTRAAKHLSAQQIVY